MKYLCIDYGSKKCGFAESDEMGLMAYPMMISENNKDLIPDTLEIIKALRITTLVLGLSLNSKGEENKIAKDAEKFAKEIQDKSGVEIVFEKEWFTTLEARKQPEAKNNVDDAAAALILQRYLDKKNPNKYSADEIPSEDDDE